jgi:hypothetical protein
MRRRYYSIIHNALKNNNSIPLIDPSVVESSEHEGSLRFCVDSSTWPPLILYKAAGATSEMAWSMINQQSLAEFISKELKTIKQKIRKRETTIQRRSTKKDTKEIKRDQIRKKSQLKWKWFFESKSGQAKDESSPSPAPNNWQTQALTQEEDSTDDMMAWLTSLDLDEKKFDFDS